MSVSTTHWRSLTKAVNLIPGNTQFLMDKIFNNANPQTHPTKFIDWDRVDGAAHIAVFVNDHEEAVQVSKRKRSREVVEVGQIRIKKPFNAVELLSERIPGTALYITETPQAAIRQVVADELEDMKNDVKRAIEYMCAQAINGTVHIVNDRVDFTIDFGFTANNAFAAGTAWDAANPTILKDIRAIKRQLATNLKLASLENIPVIAIAGYNVVDAMYADTAVQNLLDNRRINIGGLEDTNTARVGRIAGVEFYEYDGQYETNDGSMERFVGEDDAFFFAMVPKAFEMHYGAIWDLQAGGYVRVPVFSKEWEIPDPSQKNILVAAAPCPVIKQPEAVVDATLL